MKKIALLALFLFWLSKPQSAMTSSDATPAPTPIMNEILFVNIVRDIELLNSWLIDKGYPKKTIDRLRYQNYQKILALYEVDQQSFKESSKYYLEYSLERALHIYAKIYIALAELLPPV